MRSLLEAGLKQSSVERKKTIVISVCPLPV